MSNSIAAAPSLKKNVSWMFLGNGFYAVAQWLQLSLITKCCTSLELGTYTLALAVTAPVFMFTGLHLRAIQVTDSAGDWKFSHFFTFRLLTILLSFLILGGYLVVAPGVDWRIFLAVAALKAIEGAAEIFNSRQQLMEQMRNVSISFMLKGVSATASIFIGAWAFHQLWIGLVLAILSNGAILLLNDYRRCKPLIEDGGLISMSPAAWKGLLYKGFPLGLVMLFLSLNTNISKYLAEYFLGTERQGVYSTISYMIVVGIFINNAIGQTFTPRLSRLFTDGQTAVFIRLMNRFILVNIGIGAACFLGALVAGPNLLTLLFNSRIAENYPLFLLIMFSGIFMFIASSLGYTLTAMKQFRVQPLINGSVLAANTAAGYFLIRDYGLYGLTYAAIASYIVQIVLTAHFIKKQLRTAPEKVAS